MTLPVRRILGWLIVLVPIAAVIAWSFLPQPVPVDVGTAAQGRFQITVEDIGRTRVRDAYVVSAPVGGRLLRIGNRAGEDVIAGKSIVAQLQPSEPAFLDARARAQAETVVRAAEAARRSAAANVTRVQAEVDHAVAELKRFETMAARDLSSKSDLENAQLQERTARAGLDAARAALNVSQYELENARMLLADFRDTSVTAAIVSLRSPVTGRVFRVLQQNEAVVSAGTPILEIGNPDDLEVIVELLSTDAVKVHPGASAAITDWGGEKELAARVRLIEPSGFTKISALGVEEQRVRVILDIVEPREAWPQLGDGFRVNARIVVSETAEAIQVPLSALFRDGTEWRTFVAQDDHALLTNIEVGQTNEFSASIVNGIQAGDRVILHPSDRIADGVPIMIRPNQVGQTEP